MYVIPQCYLTRIFRSFCRSCCHFLSRWRDFLRRAFFNSARTIWAKFAPSGFLSLEWGLPAPPFFLIGVPSLLYRQQSRVL
eukprot:CCRYP_015283-RA/>CCRYP_015283-RA protein AED:0.16 eAED:0.16 QI:102/1/1/1/0/0/2/5/80